MSRSDLKEISGLFHLLSMVPGLIGFKNMFFLLFLAGSAQALELGQIKVESNLNEILKASFSIDNTDADNLSDIRLSLTDTRSYQLQGESQPPDLPDLSFILSTGEGSQHIVHITSADIIREPVIEILVIAADKHSSLVHRYSLRLDAGSNESVSGGTVQPLTAPLQNSIQVKSKSLSLIAQDLYLHENYSVYQIMRALYLNNTLAFRQGNIGRLKSGSRLIIPTEGSVAEVTRQEAVNFVYAASRDRPFNVSTGTQ